VELPDREVFGRGGAAIVEPDEGALIAGPLYDQEGMVIADCDLRVGLHAKRWFDAVGHYSREDVLVPTTGLVQAAPPSAENGPDGS
jgi:nitrilase